MKYRFPTEPKTRYPLRTPFSNYPQVAWLDRPKVQDSVVGAPPTSAPSHATPAGAVDTHSHIFGPFGRFPTLRPSVYALPNASPEAHRSMRQTLGVDFGVITQPAPYADDPSAMLDAIAKSNGVLRGIAVAGKDVSDDCLASWANGGIVGLRFVEMLAPNGARYPGSIGLDELVEMAPRMREHGLHAQIWADVDQLAERLPKVSKLGVRLVLDHMAMPRTERGENDPAFRSIVDHLGSEDLWAKLVVCRVPSAMPNYSDLRPFHDALLEAAPERLLWGSDWPYVRLDPTPDAGAMLNIFHDWVADTMLRTAILVDNPARLYNFDVPTGDLP